MSPPQGGLRTDREGGIWCPKHKVLAIMHARRLTHECPFCWVLDGPENHACLNPKCFCGVVRKAVAEGSAPWMTAHGQEQYRRAFA